MVKKIIILAIALISFIGTLTGLVWMLGESPLEIIQSYTDPEGFAEIEAKRQADSADNQPTLGTLAHQLKEREKSLEERKLALDEREKQLTQREDDLAKSLSDIKVLEESITESMDVAAENRATKLKTVAITVESMEPESAAERLESMPTDEISEILLSVSEKKRAPILDAMSMEIATRVIKGMIDTGF